MVRTTVSRGSRTTIRVTSYITGKPLGTFKNEREFFRNNPRERQALNRVNRFNRRTGQNITTIKQIPRQRRMNTVRRRWDR